MARYYDSLTGTFCSADPLAGHPEDPQSWNRYPYGRNDPIDITDPSGQHWWSLLFDYALQAAGGALGGFLEGLIPESDAALLAEPAANPGGTFLGLLQRPVAQVGTAAAGGAGDGARAAGLGAGLGGGLGAAAGQATDKPKTPEQNMGPALTTALEALKKKPCADMYGTPQSRAKGFTPQNVLNGIVSGTKYGRIAWADKGGGGWGVALTRPTFPFIPGQASGVVTTINTYLAPVKTLGYWSEGDPTENAMTLLHELGHAFNFIRHAGGFSISNFAEAKDNYAFDKEVKKNCF